MIRAAAITAVAALAACGDESGALVDVTQAPAIADTIDVLHMYVGVSDGVAFRGRVRDGDELFLDTPLVERPYTIRLVPSDGETTDAPVRLVVLGKHDGVVVGAGVLDLARIPGDAMLRYELELQPAGQLVATDTGCVIGEGGALIVGKDDGDCDGFTTETDCDDADPAVYPGAYDACEGASVGVDDDCNGTEDDGDLDADEAICPRDCDDNDAARSPDLDEDCVDGIDNDCDLVIDEGMPERCMNGIDDDCDPLTTDGGLGSEEICADGFDNDCDLEIDEGRTGAGGVLDPDIDGDGTLCALDCDDDDPLAFPGNNEVCDTSDNDCEPATHPAPSPCFDYTTDPCLYGFRTCDETQGFYADACEAVAANPVPVPAACDQFASCDTANDDRLVCGGNPVSDCSVMVMTTNAVCPGAKVALAPPTNAGTCLWQIIGGALQQGWKVGLVPAGSTVAAATSTSCEVAFVVEQVPPGLQPGTFGVALTVNFVYFGTHVVTILPERHAVCAVPSLSCLTTTN